MSDCHDCPIPAVHIANVATDSKTNAIATATQAAPADECLLIQGFIISANGAPASPVQASVKYGTTTLFTVQIPANAFAPIVKDFGSHPILLPEGSSASLSVPALGAGVTCDLALFTLQEEI